MWDGKTGGKAGDAGMPGEVVKMPLPAVNVLPVSSVRDSGFRDRML